MWVWLLIACSEGLIAKVDPPVSVDGADTDAADTDAADTDGPGDPDPIDTDAPGDPAPIDTDAADTDPPDTDRSDTDAADTDRSHTDAPEPVDTDVVDPDPLANPCGPPIIDPYFTGGAFGGFQSVPGSGYQTTITVTLPCPASRVEVTILDPDYPANVMIAYVGGIEVGRAVFIGDGSPGVLTRDTQAIAWPGITRVELVPDPIDYVAYDLVLYY